MTSRQHDLIDEKIEAEIKRLKKEHPNLGHEGLMDCLSQQGIHLDEAEFKQYVRKHKLAPGILGHTWGWVAASRWFGVGPSSPPKNRWYRRRLWRKRRD
jgi:hypothetical protein